MTKAIIIGNYYIRDFRPEDVEALYEILGIRT